MKFAHIPKPKSKMTYRPSSSRRDVNFLVECYADWPSSDYGPMTPDRAFRNLRRWENRDGLDAAVFEVDGTPVGFMLWSQNFFVCKVYDMVVHPNERGKGYSTDMTNLFRQKMRDEAVVAAEFDALPDNRIANKVKAGRFKKTGEKVGEQTGLPLVGARVTTEDDL